MCVNSADIAAHLLDVKGSVQVKGVGGGGGGGGGGTSWICDN